MACSPTLRGEKVMKIGIISDLHLGKSMYRADFANLNKFEKHVYDVFDKNIDILNEEKPDIVIIAGDIFDKENPSSIAIQKWIDGMKKLEIPSLIISGNHDFGHKNYINGVNPISYGLTDKVIAFADYEVKSYETGDYLFVLYPFVYSSKDDISSMLQEVKKIAVSSKAKHKILIAHGITEHYGTITPLGVDEHTIPKNIVGLFEYTIIGHIHDAFQYEENKCKVISTGAIVNWQGQKDETGPLFITENQIYRKNIPTCHSIKYSGKNVNDFLRNVGLNIYNITTDEDIDNDVYIKAKEKAMSIVINRTNTAEEEKETKKLPDFISWISVNFKDKTDIFREAILVVTGKSE